MNKFIIIAFIILLILTLYIKYNNKEGFDNNSLNNILIEITKNKLGIEIGGPSITGEIIYENATNMDNVIFSEKTLWSNHLNSFIRTYSKSIKSNK
jgi:hypothetical protein